MEKLLFFVTTFQEYLWSFPMLLLLFGTHIYFTMRLHFIQRKIPEGIRLSFSKKERTDTGMSPYEALSTALAATIGTGNIIGVSTAIAIGGPGAVFWCWVTGVFGIATCYAECFLAVKCRIRNRDGSYQGGPMYVLGQVLKQRGLAVAFAIFTIFASFGIGCATQVNAIATVCSENLGIPSWIVGGAVAFFTALVLHSS